MNLSLRLAPVALAFLLFGSAFLLCSASALAEDAVTLEKIEGAPPADKISAEVLAQLQDTGVRVLNAGKAQLEIWPCKQWVVSEQTSDEILFGFRPGALMGVVRIARKSADFRDQDLGRGWYLMRYAHQPVDGNHVGTSPTRDFFLLTKAEEDSAPGETEYKDLVEKSKAAAETNHPGLLLLQKTSEDGQVSEGLRHNTDKEWWIARLSSKAMVDGKEQDVSCDLVVLGHAAE